MRQELAMAHIVSARAEKAIDEHNGQVIRKALTQLGGKAVIGKLGLYASDDETVLLAAERAGLVVRGRVVSLVKG